MSTKALFISVADLKKRSIIDGNVDSSKIVQYIEVAQDLHIQNYLGGKLYKKIQQLVVSGEISQAGNSNYQTLLDDYIKPMLIWYTQSTILPYMMFSITNGGVGKHISESSDTATHEDMTYLAQRMNDTAEFYTKRFLDYICSYSNLFPEYTTSANEEMNPDRDVNYTGGWYV